MLKYHEANPLNVHNLRQVLHLPLHFVSVLFDIYITEKDIVDWLFEHLEGRFYVGTTDIKTPEGKYERKACVAFELPSEASYFSMMLPTFNKSAY